MSTRKCKDVAAGLVKKGFQLREGDHQYFVYHRSSDAKKTPIFTKISHGEREIGDFQLGHMAKQCKVTRADFLDLVDCPMDRAAYEAKLAEQLIGLTGKGWLRNRDHLLQKKAEGLGDPNRNPSTGVYVLTELIRIGG